VIFARVFGNQRSSVTDARHFTLTVLEGMPNEFIDSVVLMVSELATNAVKHAHSRFELVIDCDDDGVVVVRVSDQGRGEAEPRNPRVTDVSGRGLQIVRALADEWGIQAPTADWRKSVWFSLRVPDRGARSDTA
jgi:anti-sigma regulatory factor (Ser/Thr protein kinase)